MTLSDLGYSLYFEHDRQRCGLVDFAPARVIQEHKESYLVQTETGIIHAEVEGKLRFNADSREDFPTVGDWVVLRKSDETLAIIHGILARRTVLARQSVVTMTERQLLACNLDGAFVTQSLDGNFNLNRLDRYLAIAYSSGIQPVVLLNKMDLVSARELSEKIAWVQKRHRNIPVIGLSAIRRERLGQLEHYLQSGKTYCFIGSSGVGKSTIINALIGNDHLKTAEISSSTRKGKHITTHRELLILHSGAILIDTPGMRELGIGDASTGVEIAFQEIERLAVSCKFPDCTHIAEPGCAVRAAIKDELLDEAQLKNYLKLKREAARFEASVREKRRKDRARGRFYKQVMQQKKKDRF